MHNFAARTQIFLPQTMYPSFFDAIGASDIERVHSATIAWIISDSCKALSISDKIKLLNCLFGTNKGDEIISIDVETEYGVKKSEPQNLRIQRKHIDIAFVTTDMNNSKELWLLENKIKAPLGNNQLNGYSELFKGDHYCLLSLIGTLPQDNIESWHLADYSQLVEAFNSVNILSNENSYRHAAIVDEYRDCISNLVTALSLFKENPNKFPGVFTNGDKAKSRKGHVATGEGLNSYIAKNSLETICQKLYFTEIINEIKARGISEFESCHVGESRGNADFAFHLGECAADREFVFDISFQKGAFKFAVSRKGYPRSKKEEMKDWLEIFRSIAQDPNNRNYKRVNTSKGRARISLSYNIDSRSWYKMDRNRFIDIIIEQLRVARQLERIATKLREPFLSLS